MDIPGPSHYPYNLWESTQNCGAITHLHGEFEGAGRRMSHFQLGICLYLLKCLFALLVLTLEVITTGHMLFVLCFYFQGLKQMEE